MSIFRTKVWRASASYDRSRDEVTESGHEPFSCREGAVRGQAVCRLRYCPATQTYAARRAAEGKTEKDIIRCLKRYIAREIYTTLLHDLRALTRA